MHSTLSAILIFLLSTGSSGITLRRRSLSLYPKAVCNDGTPASFFFSKNSVQSSHLLIYLKGGGSCKDNQECQKRCLRGGRRNKLCTGFSKPKMTVNSKTIWSSDSEENPAFHDFGKVYVKYCSSDVYSGQRNASAATNGLYFHGKYIIEALVKDIIKRKPNVGSMKQLVLAGSSAGAFGVALNCDMVAESFHKVNKDLDVRCIADGNDFFPTTVSREGCNPYKDGSGAGHFWQSKADESCIESSSQGGSDCKFFADYYNSIETPLMVVSHYIDTIVQGPCAAPLNDDNRQFWEKWEQEMYNLALRFIQDKPQNGLFLSNCLSHVSMNRPGEWGNMDVPLVNADGSILYKDLVRNWLTGEGPYQAMDLPLKKNPKCPRG